MDEATFWKEIGKLQGHVEALEARLTALEARPASSGGGGKEKKWHEVGKIQHIITHAARCKDKNENIYLVLWSSSAGKRLGVFFKYETILWNEWFKETLGTPIDKLPILPEFKGNGSTNMVAIKRFIYTQIEKSAEGETHNKFTSESVALPTTGGQTNHAPQPATTPQTQEQAKPTPSHSPSQDELYLEAWDQYGIPEAVARVVIPLQTVEGARETMKYLATKVTKDNFEKMIKDLCDFAFEEYILSESQVKQALDWANEANNATYKFYPPKGERCIHHYFLVVIVSVGRLRSLAAKLTPADEEQKRRL